MLLILLFKYDKFLKLTFTVMKIKLRNEQQRKVKRYTYF